MIRNRSTIVRELERADAMAAAENLGDSLDNDGNVALTGYERRGIARRQATKLRQELADLDRVFGRQAERFTDLAEAATNAGDHDMASQYLERANRLKEQA
jgi:hypothetical protein